MTVFMLCACILGAGPGAVAPVSAQTRPGRPSLEQVLPQLPARQLQELRDKGSIRYHSEDQGIEFRYLPSSGISGAVRRSFRGYDPNIVNEVLFLMPLPDRPAGREELMLHLYNTMRRVSTLDGIEYDSDRAGGLAPLFTDVYAVSAGRSRNRIADPVVTHIPSEDVFTVHMRDANFGSAHYEALYLGSSDAVSFGLKNTDTLSYIVPVVRQERMRLQLVAVPLEDELLVYGVVGVQAGGLVRRMVHLPSAFRKRIESLHEWFTDRIY